MAASYKDLKTSRQWSATTGLSKSQFEELVPLFRKAYIGIYGMELQIRQEESSQESHLKTYEDFLFFVLFSLKSGLTYDALGFVFGMSGGTAKKKQELGLKLLKVALESIGVMPKRFVASVAEFEELMADQDTLIIDGTEQDIQRPKDKDKQKSNYSGKKKTHRKVDPDQ